MLGELHLHNSGAGKSDQETCSGDRGDINDLIRKSVYGFIEAMKKGPLSQEYPSAVPPTSEPTLTP